MHAIKASDVGAAAKSGFNIREILALYPYALMKLGRRIKPRVRSWRPATGGGSRHTSWLAGRQASSVACAKRHAKRARERESCTRAPSHALATDTPERAGALSIRHCCTIIGATIKFRGGVG